MSSNTNIADISERPFLLITSKKNRKKITLQKQCKYRDDLCDFNEAHVIRKINEAQDEIINSEYFKCSADTILNSSRDSIEKIICFGIGHFSECHASKYQLAFILGLKTKFHIASVIFHEPILARSEVNILKTLNCIVEEENFEGKSEIRNVPGTRTLVYLPHCPKQLTNNLLWKNWNPQLSQLSMVCNSFGKLIESTPQRFLEKDANYITRIAPHTKEICIINNFQYNDIFNDTSLHTFCINEIPPEFWKLNTEPVYADSVELISRDLISKLSIQD